jgi:hypothetical protein
LSGTTSVPWTTRSVVINADNFGAAGTYSLKIYVWLATAATGSSNSLAFSIDNVGLFIKSYGYREDTSYAITGVDTSAGSTYRLQGSYYTAGDSEADTLFVYNFGTNAWDNFGFLSTGGSSVSPYAFDYALNSVNYVNPSGTVMTRLLQNENDNVCTSFIIDYIRVSVSKAEGIGIWTNQDPSGPTGWDYRSPPDNAPFKLRWNGGNYVSHPLNFGQNYVKIEALGPQDQKVDILIISVPRGTPISYVMLPPYATLEVKLWK